MDQLKRRGFSLANRCPLCRKDEENIEHLLLHCPNGLGNLVLFVDVCGSCLGAPMVNQELVFWQEQFPYQKKVKEKLGGLLLFVCYGQSGRKGIESFLKMKSSPSKNLEVLLSILFVLGQGRL